MVLLQVLIVFLLIYIIFCLAPSVVMFCSVFRRCRRVKKASGQTYYLPFAARLEKARERLLAMPSKEIAVTSRDGVVLRADVFDGGYDKTAILVHGYRADPLSNCGVLAEALYERGYNIFLVHLRGHGKSGGRYITMGQKEQYDVLSFITAAATENIRHIVVCGVSLGATAIALASNKITDPRVSALVLDCGFYSFYDQLKADCGKLHIPPFTVLPQVGLFYRLLFGGSIKATAGASLKENRIPTVILHGTGDKSVPFSHGEKNYADCASEKEAIFVADADHTCALLQDEEAFRRLMSFLDRHTES